MLYAQSESLMVYLNKKFIFSSVGCQCSGHPRTIANVCCRYRWLDRWIEVGHVFSLYNFGVDRLGVTYSHSSYSILCLSVAVGTCVNFVATDSVFIRWWEHVSTSQQRSGFYVVGSPHTSLQIVYIFVILQRKYILISSFFILTHTWSIKVSFQKTVTCFYSC
jgi:hypothetical protein